MIAIRISIKTKNGRLNTSGSILLIPEISGKRIIKNETTEMMPIIQ
jgi:hypothetical protein